jgi:hypothetical protein
VPEVYAHCLVLCRADQHVAWRGAHLPAEVDDLVGQLRGEGERLRAGRKAVAWEGGVA